MVLNFHDLVATSDILVAGELGFFVLRRRRMLVPWVEGRKGRCTGNGTGRP
jgi:hypothetical protein